MATLVTPCVWGWGGGWMGPHGTRGKPRRGGWGRSWPYVFHLWMPGPPSHMVPRRSAGLPLLEAASRGVDG